MISNGVVTLFCVDENGENFKKKGCFSAWVHRVKRIKTELGGVRESDRFDVRIGTGVLDNVQPGDLIYFGRAGDTAELSECSRVASVVKNDFGSNPHWHLETEYIYR